MREFYVMQDSWKSHSVPANQRGQMFRAIEKALTLADTPATQSRLHDLALYCSYVDLFDRYADAKGEARQAAYEALIRHAWRMRSTMLVHTWGLYRDLAGRDKSVRMPIEVSFFFSGRRRHTRWSCDWSSDVCSSDLVFRGFRRQGVRQDAADAIRRLPLHAPRADRRRRSDHAVEFPAASGDVEDRPSARVRKRGQIGRASCRERG